MFIAWLDCCRPRKVLAPFRPLLHFRLVRSIGAAQDVHGQGLFYSLDPTDYIRNLTAIKALLNEKNNLQRQLETAVDPNIVRYATIVGAVTNVFAMAIVGIGTNLLTAENVPSYAPWLFGIGVILSFVATLSPIAAAFLPRRKKQLKE